MPSRNAVPKPIEDTVIGSAGGNFLTSFGRLSEDTAEAVWSLRGVICPAKKGAECSHFSGTWGLVLGWLFPQVKFL